MTYAHFLAAFLLPALAVAVLVAIYTIRAKGFGSTLRIGGCVLAVLVVVAVMWTAPWDSWIIGRGAWTTPPNSVSARVFRVPVEELGFMAAQVLVVGVWTLALLAHRVDGYNPAGPWPWARAPLTRVSATCLWMALIIAGAVATVASDRLLYQGSMVVLVGIPLAIQRAVGADVLRRFRVLRLFALAPVAYFWLADRIAIGQGTWSISTQYTTGWKILGLPIEEYVFFWLTSLLIVDGLVLACHQEIHRRLPVGSPTLRRIPGHTTRVETHSPQRAG
ncbi:hypothetical protein DFR70_11585 [Nocardia tenerifensis]|uniref:Lycopene cyclase domain-containing protein n=1 Tax=Nocardia tenerifensis TaxID=228006 RepID=A0A318JVZ2_9NOCA|nr:lycopene cyclase domain-containing protein [Nocardia tenerifensis]PXX58112.1 hypothetical protein DFR70_11585 [Nocardia tenerifensis]